VSPDGAFLLYDYRGLVRRDIATGETRRLTTEEGAVSPRVSPDGRQVAYVARGRKELRLVSSTVQAGDATPRVLYLAVELADVMVHDWAPDGRHILAVGAANDDRSSWKFGVVQMLLISVTDGAASVLKTLKTTEGWAAIAEHSACFSSDGRYVLYDDAAAGSSDTDIYFVATDGSREGPLVEHPGNDFVLGCVPGSDQLLFASERTGALSTWTMRVTDGKPQGPAELVKDHLGPIVPIGLTRTGAYFYGINTGKREIFLGTFDAPTGAVLGQRPVSLRSPDFHATPSWSPDGRYLAYTSFTGRAYTEARKVVILALDRGEERVLHPDLTWFRETNRLRWSPDGRSLLTVASNSQGMVSLYKIDVQSGAVSGPLLPHDANVLFFEWSKDSKAIYYLDSQRTSRSVIRVHDLEAGRNDIVYRPVESGDTFLRYLELSPDGAWLAVGSGRSDSPTLEPNAVLIIPTGGGRPRQVFRAESGQTLNGFAWTPDGAHLLVNSMGARWRVPADGAQPQRLGPAIPRLYFHPDGKRVVSAAAAESSVEVWVMENFLPEARAPR
jgi:Tol biopolymer transport system component